MHNANLIPLEKQQFDSVYGLAHNLRVDSRGKYVEFSAYRWELENSDNAVEGIVGGCAALIETLDLVRMVAPTDSTVLIEGETGTGKELFARAIHAHSRRRNRPFIKLNCAAIPAPLLESELFGYERGAFTGAMTRKLGRFDQADGGTLFLDEIGDMPLELQAKLLRVLQEQEFEPLGAVQTRKVNVRVVAATNQNLSRLMLAKQFRMDLYYRLNVFPISLPPLRKRREDIPLLVAHFVSLYSERMSKEIRKVSSRTMLELQQNSWPGNVRELQNVIERATVLTFGDVLTVPALFPLQQLAHEPVTLDEAERSHIAKILFESKGVIGGPNGAAARLGIPRTTLIYKMRKRGLSRSHISVV